MTMRFIDTHLHLDEKRFADPREAAAHLNAELELAHIAHGVVLHVDFGIWSLEQVMAAIAPYSRLHGMACIHPAIDKMESRVSDAIEKYGCIGLKLHPRFQKIRLDDPATDRLVRVAGECKVPVLIDAFPDGLALMQGFSPLDYARLAERHPKTRFIWAHMGGHHILDMMMLMKLFPNVVGDISLSLLYYHNRRVTDDILYAMSSLKYARVMYGSDYPDRPVRESLDRSLDIMHEYGLSLQQIDQVFYHNAAQFFCWKD